MFCWNIIPMNIALFQIAHRKKKYTTFRNAYQYFKELDKRNFISILNMMHLLVIISYYILSYFFYNTITFRNDRTQFAVKSIFTSCIAYHCILNYFFTERVRLILKATLIRKPKPQIALTSMKKTVKIRNIMNIIFKKKTPI